MRKFIAFVIMAIIIACSNAGCRNLTDTNGYTSKRTGPDIHYCQTQPSPGIIKFVPCGEVKHDQSI